MKLDFLLLRDAAARQDIATIVRIFIRHFPKLAARQNREWRLARATWYPADRISLRTPDGQLVYADGRFERDRGIYSVDGSHVITYADEFQFSLDGNPNETR